MAVWSISYRSSAYWKLFWARIMCLFFSPNRPMYMPQLLTGTSMPARPPLSLLPTLASNHSILTRSPGCKSLICLSTSFMVHQDKRAAKQNIKTHEIYQFTNSENQTGLFLVLRIGALRGCRKRLGLYRCFLLICAKIFSGVQSVISSSRPFSSSKSSRISLQAPHSTKSKFSSSSLLGYFL